MFYQETQTYRRHRHIEDTDTCKTQTWTQTIRRIVLSDQFLGFTLAAATGNDPLAAGNIAATLGPDYNSDPTLIKADFFAVKSIEQSRFPALSCGDSGGVKDVA